jgi:hypothetical protein
MALIDLFEAICDECQARSGVRDGPRAIAIVRLLRDDWIIRTDGTAKCPRCAGPSSVIPRERA